MKPAPLNHGPRYYVWY